MSGLGRLRGLTLGTVAVVLLTQGCQLLQDSEPHRPLPTDYVRAAGFFSRAQPEGAGYGAYTYVVFPARTEKSRTFLGALLRRVDLPGGDLPLRERGGFNIFYLPVTAPAGAAYALAESAAKADGEVLGVALRRVEEIYDFSLAREILHAACAALRQGGRRRSCDGDGPYLVIQRRPRWVGAAPQAVFDLAAYSERSYPQLIARFTQPNDEADWNTTVLDIYHWLAALVEGGK